MSCAPAGKTSFRGTVNITNGQIDPQVAEFYVYDAQGRAIYRRLLSNIMTSGNTGASVSGKINIALPYVTDQPGMAHMGPGVKLSFIKYKGKIYRGKMYVVTSSMLN